MFEAETIVAIATPAGHGAIGVIRLSGKDAVSIADRLCKNRKLAEKPANTVHFARIWTADYRQVIDEVVISIFRAPRSYTREDVVEISCHGSSYILEQVLMRCVQEGARLAKAGEFTLRAFLNGQMDLAQAEAVADLIAAENEAAHKAAMTQMRGGFSEEIKILRQELIHFASLIELELDFGEEDVEFANRHDLEELIIKLQQRISILLESFRLGNVLKSGIATVIVGRPNAGKSTLLNTLLNEERAIVSPIAGTTRDTIEEALFINGLRFRLVDTAGIREATDTIEAMGVEKSLEKARQSAILVYVADAVETSNSLIVSDLESIVHEHQRNTPVLVVLNKTDMLPPVSSHDIQALEFALAASFESVRVLAVSAKNKIGIDALKQNLLTLANINQLSDNATIVTNSRHAEALSAAADSLARVLGGLHGGITGDFLAMDIRHALRYLGEITGEVDVEDLLDNIFSKFCIGK